MKPSLKNIYQFYYKAAQSTYAGSGKYQKKPERSGFSELVYQENNLYYRDSFIGFYRSRGMELIRYKEKPIFATLYGGGMLKGQEKLANKTFAFLKQAMLKKYQSFYSFRGPKKHLNKSWQYSYQQTGSIAEFQGY